MKTINTKNEIFDRIGFLKIEKLYDPVNLIEPLPNIPRSTRDQVPNSIERYNYFRYMSDYKRIQEKIEEIIGRKLYPTYFFDRFYFTGQELKYHRDRPSCEISLTYHISSNPGFIDWPIKIENDKKEICTILMKPGDAVLYKGCDRFHWRDPMPSYYSKMQLAKRKLFKQEDDSWYHQVFFHFVLADGYRAHFAYDGGANNF